MKRVIETAPIGIGFIDPKQGSRPAVLHGLRSIFRDQIAENQHSREAAELQLSHHVGSKVEHAYYRTDLTFKGLRYWMHGENSLGTVYEITKKNTQYFRSSSNRRK